MHDLLLTDYTRAQLLALQADPPQGLLICGPTGIGKHTVAYAWANALTSPQHISLVEPDEKSTITIDTVRNLYQRTRSKHDSRQVVIMTDAQSMGSEAQNAFLKLLEEPNSNVTFILTAPSTESLLPTITSRVQQVVLPRLSQRQLQPLAKKLAPNASTQELAQLLFVADGRPGLLHDLLQDPALFEHHKQLMQRAKQLLGADQYERLAMVAELAKDRATAVEVLEAVNRMLYSQILRDPQPRWLRLAECLEICLIRLAQNGNPRAQLTALFTAY